MKRIKLAAILAVASFGIGGAVIASNTTNNPNVMNTAAEGQPAHWVPLTDQNGCDPETERACIGYQEFPGAPVTDIVPGEKR
ncbi:exported hypothetical protein [Sphingobacterium sp. PM2-P1-29]|nr:exported hypothetical protein [Sphingobacterium sp. PM2-P1-29]